MKKIPLGGKRGRGLFALVDDADYDQLKDFGWSLSVRNYVRATINGEAVKMHRLIMQTPKNWVTDHINHNPLDNRRSNLRVCTQRQNVLNTSIRSNNTSGFKGVAWHKATNRWAAFITVDGKKHHLGLFENPLHAALVYDSYARVHHGEYGALNNPLLTLGE